MSDSESKTSPLTIFVAVAALLVAVFVFGVSIGVSRGRGFDRVVQPSRLPVRAITVVKGEVTWANPKTAVIWAKMDVEVHGRFAPGEGSIILADFKQYLKTYPLNTGNKLEDLKTDKGTRDILVYIGKRYSGSKCLTRTSVTKFTLVPNFKEIRDAK